MNWSDSWSDEDLNDFRAGALRGRDGGESAGGSSVPARLFNDFEHLFFDLRVQGCAAVEGNRDSQAGRLSGAVRSQRPAVRVLPQLLSIEGLCSPQPDPESLPATGTPSVREAPQGAGDAS